jgi:hypothetical protein
MKTERRHELETNTLARRLAAWIERVKPYGRSFIGLLVALAVVAVGAFLLTRQSKQTEAMAWDAYYLATEGGRPMPDELAMVAESHVGTSVEPWARLAQADAELQVASRTLFVDKAEARRRLNVAIDTYQKLKERRGDELVRERATFGLARAYESLGRLDAADSEYRDVTGAFADAAESRADLIAKASSKAFYDWFAEAELPRTPLPGDPGVPGTPPDASLPGLDLPEPPGPSGSAEGDAEAGSLDLGVESPISPVETSELPEQSEPSSSESGAVP